jgi:DNA phosphorothioation-dependent restriction protein DptH
VILFAQSAFSYIRRQLDDRAAVRGKLLFMMPSLPPAVVLNIGNSLVTYCTKQPEMAPPVIRVSMPLANEWITNNDPKSRELVDEISAHGWRDERGNLTHYRNLISEGTSLLSVLLIGVDRVTDSSSMEDFHQCSLENIWKEELGSTFSGWCTAVLDNVGYDKDNIIRFDAILNALVERGLSDVLQISTFLEELDFSGAQDGRDAERILLTSLNGFGLPFLGNFRSSNIRTIGTYIDDALAFFSYDSFLDDRTRDKALRSIDDFKQGKLLEEAFDPLDRPTFSSDETFIDGIRDYVATGDTDLRKRLLQCDFVSIRDTVLSYRAPKAPKEPKTTIRKIAGGPIEVVLNAVWDTLSDFRKAADDLGLFAHEELRSIDVEANLFKHDCDGDSSEARRNNALGYLRRLLGGVDSTVEKHLQNSPLGGDERQIRCHLVKDDLDCQSSRVAEPYLQFAVVVKGAGLDRPVVKQFAWRLPIAEPYRVADELLQWAAKAVSRADGYCLPVFQVAFYEELMLAKDEDETRRVLLHCLRDERDAICNLLKAPDMDNQDPLLPRLQKLAFAYDAFLQTAATEGLHAALNSAADEVRRSYESACEAYSDETSLVNSSTAALLFRAFLLIRRRENAEGSRWMWEPYESSCAVTVLHPALIEMLQAQVNYLLTAFATVAASELKAPGARRFRDLTWRGYVDLAAIQTPLSGLIKDRNKVLDTDVRGKDLIHRIGSAVDSDASLTTRLLLRYDSFEDDDLSDADLFRRSRESTLLYRILEDYRRLHPHGEDGLAIAVYHNGDIQPVIAAVDEFLRIACAERSPARKDYAFSVTVFSESSDDTSVSRWVAQWKDRWADSENQASLSHYRRSALSIAHRIVSPDNYYRQFIQLIGDSLEIDIVFLMDIIRAGNQGNDFETVEPYDVLTRTLKFPILEKPFCALLDPSRKLQRARVLSNRQFRSTTSHAELMARLKSRDVRKNAHHVVLGYGDYAPWQGVVDALHRKAEWVICIDPNIDERLIAEKGRGTNEAREIIGFGSGVGAHGEANFTISTEQFRHADVLHKLDASIREIYSGWNPETYTIVAQRVLGESQRLSGLSLVRATGVGQYVRDFMAYSLVRKLLHADKNSLCDQVISLDAYQHWFESAETGMRPDLLWIVARIQDDGRLHLDLRLIECKLAKASDAHLQKAREQLESGLRQLVSVFKPRMVNTAEDDRPDQRYWWLQLYRLIASKAEIAERDQRRVLTSLERLAEGDYDVEWRAAAITFWTDQPSDGLSETAIWTHAFDGNELGISLITTGSEFVRILCEQGWAGKLPWGGGSITFRSGRTPSTSEGGDDSDGSPEVSSVLQTAVLQANSEETTRRDVPPVMIDSGGFSLVKADRVLLGTTIPGSRKVYWEFGHKELNNRHILIFGSSGMGKTYTIQCLLSELGRAQQNSLIVDYTNGFFDNQLEPEFKDLLRPLQHIVRREPLAINPFRQQAESLGGESLPETASSTAQRVSGVFSEVYNFGDQQKSALYQAVKNGLESRFFDTLMERPGGNEMTLEDLIPELESLAEIKGTQGQSANSVISKLRPFLDQNPFGAEDPRGWDRLFSDEHHRCHVIQLAGFMKDAARLVTEFSLIDLYWYYRGRGNQTRPRVVVLDEVQNLDHRDESPLAQLLREGRKFGFSLILATQIMSNLDRDEKDRLFLAAHKLFFRPADTELRAYAEIAAVTTGEKVDEWVKKLAALKKGECYSLGPSLNDSLGKLEVKAFRVKILSFAERMTVHE